MMAEKKAVPRKATAAVVISGGAPVSPLPAGFLCAVYEKGKTFTTLYTSGAGATIGMLYLAPKNKTTPEALRCVLKAGISDEIWNWFPLPYKTFFKSGPFATLYATWALSMHLHDSSFGRRFERWCNDWIDLWACALCPTDLNFLSQGLCEPHPFIQEEIDFEKLRRFKGTFFMNAYCIDDAKIQEFGKEEVSIEHFYAALSFPFIYRPTRIGSKYYYEGSAQDPLNLDKLMEKIRTQQVKADSVVLLDVLGALEPALVRLPRNLIDAFGISIMTPIVALARQNCELYRTKRMINPKIPELLPVTFDIPKSQYPYVSDWSYSNLHSLWRIGYKAGLNFLEKHASQLPDRVPEGPDPLI